MLKKLHIKNFKGWSDTGEIEMAPITLFFGTNSSGKSSIGQFLMMLKQTVESSDRRSVFFTGNPTSAVELGSYKDMVFQRDLKNKISFSYTWHFKPALKFKDSEGCYEGESLSFDAEVSIDSLNQHPPSVESFSYRLADAMSITMTKSENKKQEYKIESTEYKLRRKMGRVWYIPAPYKFYAFPEEVAAYHQNADFVQELNLQHEKLFRTIFYLGPMRKKAARFYPWNGTEPPSVGYSGEDTIAAILAAKNRKISLGFKKTAKPITEIIALALKKMELIDEFKVEPLAANKQESDVYDVKVRSRGRGKEDFVDLPDVGFGISQVLPVLVQCFYAPKNSIIIMEQPEIHLHPSAQAALADIMIDVINSRENREGRNIQLIIETHSEHFLRRLQRRIAEETISRDSVSAYFANAAQSPARLEKLELDVFGNICNWPENFFGDEMEDVMSQAKATAKRRSRKI
jgi:predicted ATPase